MCALEFPGIEQLYQKYKDQGLIVLGMSGDGLGSEDLATINAFKSQTMVTFPLLVGDTTKDEYADTDGAITPYPLDVIADKDGNIVYLRHEVDIAAMEQVIVEQLAAQ